MERTLDKQIRSVIVVGGGLSGLAAATSLSEAGFQVQLIERRPYLGGRASSYEHPGTGEVIDNCQHVLLGNCVNLIHFYRRLGVENSIRWFDRIVLLEPGGRASELASSSLPAPFHSMPSFLSSPAFSLSDKFAIARGLASFVLHIPRDSDENFAQWLARHGQTRGAIERFWKPILVSALNEEMDRISVRYAGQVMRLSLLCSPGAGHMGIPSIPLTELYGKAIGYIEERGGAVHLRTNAEGFFWAEDNRQWVVRTPAGEISGDAMILALSFEGLSKVLPLLPKSAESERLQANLDRFEHSPITGVHLWFDRRITELDHAMLLDATIQWMFHKTRLQRETRETSEGSYVELVISASRSLIPMQRQEIVDLALEELGRFFPKVKEARLLKATVVKEVRATYSIRPGLEELRPNASSPWPRVYLAGDWVATGWPATMEGAVRSGYLSAEAVTEAAGDREKMVQPDLPGTGFMRWLA